jgi:V8-like Glu-specific endopeptidase
MPAWSKSVSCIVVSIAILGCGSSPGSERTDSVSQGKIIGDNDLIPVVQDGANIPAKYRPLIDAFGEISMGCTATHVGDGLVLTAGHCFEAPATRTNNMPCDGTTVDWGVRKDKPKYLTSNCQIVLAAEQSDKRDYAIFRVSPIPPVSVKLDFSRRPAVGTPLTIFGHPQIRPLEWSQICSVQPASNGNFGVDQFSHQCDTEPGSSGSTILSDTSLAVVGIHDGGVVPWNYGTFLAATPIGEFVGGTTNKPPTVSFTAPAANATVSGSVTVSANASDPDGSVAKVVFELPDGTSVTRSSAPFSVSWDSTLAQNGSHTLRATATDNAGATTTTTRPIVVSNGTGGPWSASGSPNMPTIDNGSACTKLTVTGTGNAADVKVDLAGHHDWRSILSATLAHGSQTNAVFATGTFPRGAGDFSVTAKPISGFSGSAAGEWTLCIVDTDAFNDTGVLKTWSVHN